MLPPARPPSRRHKRRPAGKACGAGPTKRASHAKRRNSHKKKVAAQNKKRAGTRAAKTAGSPAQKAARRRVARLKALHKKKGPHKACSPGAAAKSIRKAKKAAKNRKITAKRSAKPVASAAGQAAVRKAHAALLRRIALRHRKKAKKRPRHMHACRLHCHITTRRSAPKAQKAQVHRQVKKAARPVSRG